MVRFRLFFATLQRKRHEKQGAEEREENQESWTGRRPVLLMGGAAAHELVPFQGGSDLKVDAVVIRTSTNPVGAQDLSHAPQADGLRAFAVQDNYILDGPTEIGLSLRGEQHSAGTDVPGKARERHTFGTGTGNGERELQLKTPGSSLFHILVILMVGAIPTPGQ
jgi:hypothetical protein